MRAAVAALFLSSSEAEVADNITLDPGSGGSTVKTDDDGTAHWQYVKAAFGADNTQTIVTASVGLPVDILSSTIDVMLGTDFSAVFGAASMVATDGSTALTIGMQSLGTDGTNAQIISTNSTGHVNIADGGNSITVDGTVTANLSATDNAVLDSIDAAVNGTLTVGSHAVTNAGTFATQVDGDALTALQLIDDPVFADDAAFTLTTSKVSMSGAIRDDSLSALSAVEGDAVPLRVGSTGALHVTGAGGGTQYNIDDAGGATDTGTLALAIRDDSLTTLTPADGDYVGLRVGSTGALHVTGGGGGTEYTEDVATPSPIVGTATMMERDDALATVTPVEGDWIGLRGSSRGALWVAHDGDVTIADGGNAITVDWAGTAPPIGAGTEAAALRVTVATDSTGTLTVDDGGTTLSIDDGGGIISVDGAELTTLAAAVSGTEMQVDVVAALPAGTNAIGKLAANADVDIGSVTPIPKTAGGLSFYKTIDLDESEEEVKATAGQVYGFFFTNSNAAVRYLKLYNATAATVVVGTTVPDMTYAIPPSNSGLFLEFSHGLAFGTAITIAATTGVADADTGAPGANEVIGTVFYK